MNRSVAVLLEGQIVSRGVLLLFLLLSLTGCSRRDVVMPGAGKEPLSREDIVAIGKKSALTMELPVDQLEVTYDEGNSRWNAYLARIRQFDAAEAKDLDQVLRNREYQAVYLDFGPDILDASSWLLVDKYSGEPVIAVRDTVFEGHQMIHDDGANGGLQNLSSGL